MFKKIKKFIDNYWYYYKWYVITALFALFALIVVVTQLLTREKYDANIIWAMNGYVPPQYVDAMEEEFEKYCEDYDGNGEVNVQVILVTFTSDGGMPSGEIEISMQQKLITQLSAGDAYIVISDEKTYDGKLDKLGIFENIEESYPENENIVGEKYYLKGTAFTQNKLLSEVIGDDTFMLMGSNELQKLSDTDKKIYTRMREAFDRMVNAG